LTSESNSPANRWHRSPLPCRHHAATTEGLGFCSLNICYRKLNGAGVPPGESARPPPNLSSQSFTCVAKFGSLATLAKPTQLSVGSTVNVVDRQRPQCIYRTPFRRRFPASFCPIFAARDCQHARTGDSEIDARKLPIGTRSRITPAAKQRPAFVDPRSCQSDRNIELHRLAERSGNL